MYVCMFAVCASFAPSTPFLTHLPPLPPFVTFRPRAAVSLASTTDFVSARAQGRQRSACTLPLHSRPHCTRHLSLRGGMLVFDVDLCARFGRGRRRHGVVELFFFFAFVFLRLSRSSKPTERHTDTHRHTHRHRHTHTHTSLSTDCLINPCAWWYCFE